MKNLFLTGLLLLASVVAYAQDDADAYMARYQRQVKYVGVAGTGIVSILDKWEKDCPEDPAQFEARHLYYLEKGRTITLQAGKGPRYLGEEPALTLKDSTGADIHYFEHITFADSLFAKASEAINRAIVLAPAALEYRADKIVALTAYEQGSPDMAAAEVQALITLHTTRHPAWTWCAEPVEEADFCALMQEFCYAFFKTGTPASYEAFRSVSEQLAARWPKSAEYQNNLGSYWLVARQQSGKALKYYNKALKLDPKNLSAAKNCVLLARREGDARLEMKYLDRLISLTEDARERLALEARLQYLKAYK